jgi:hypothetical protein
LQEVFQNPKVAPHWPMYLRNVKQYVKNAAPSFDERRFGFATFLEAVRAGQRAGLFRLERNRQGILRVFPGNQFPQREAPAPPPTVEVEEQAPIIEAAPVVEEQIQVIEAEPVIEAAAPPPEAVEAAPVEEFALAPEDRPARKRRAAPKKKSAATQRIRAATPRRRRKKTSEAPSET